MPQDYPTDQRNRVRQVREKARYDRAGVHAVLDAGLVAQVAFVDDGLPVIVPMIYGRSDETLYLHGARKARVVRLLERGASVALNVTLVDAIVAARSSFHSSMNYRSVTVFGTPSLVDDADEKLHALRVISEHLMPGRWDELRSPWDRELKMTGVLRVPIEAASAKISAKMPEDEQADYDTPIWAGLLPVEQRIGEPRPDPLLANGIEPSASLARLAGTRR